MDFAQHTTASLGSHGSSGVFQRDTSRAAMSSRSKALARTQRRRRTDPTMLLESKFRAAQASSWQMTLRVLIPRMVSAACAS
jgi:hypothetical protein